MKFSIKLLIVFLIAVVIATYLHFRSYVTDEAEYMEYLSSLHAERIEHVLEEKVAVTNILKDILVDDKGTTSVKDLNNIARLLFREDEHVAISFLPHGVVKFTYPPVVHDDMNGHDLFQNPKTKEAAQLSKDEEKTVFAGPYTLTNGETGISALTPVFYDYKEEKYFWGFVLTILKVTDQLLEGTGIFDVSDLGYEYSISTNYQGETSTVFQSESFMMSLAQNEIVRQVGSADWHFHIYSKTYLKDLIGHLVFIAFSYLGIAFILYLFVDKLEDKLELTEELSLLDPLTELKNRKGLENFIEDPDNYKKGYALFYLDLNKFKPINDSFGHEAGDKLLVAFSRRLAHRFPKDTCIVRLGGDEFLIVVPKNVTDGVRDQIIQRVIALTEEPFYIDDRKFEISTSVGFAQFPDDGKTFDLVLARADEAMFICKEKCHEALLKGELST